MTSGLTWLADFCIVQGVYYDGMQIHVFSPLIGLSILNPIVQCAESWLILFEDKNMKSHIKWKKITPLNHMHLVYKHLVELDR